MIRYTATCIALLTGFAALAYANDEWKAPPPLKVKAMPSCVKIDGFNHAPPVCADRSVLRSFGVESGDSVAVTIAIEIQHTQDERNRNKLR